MLMMPYISGSNLAEQDHTEWAASLTIKQGAFYQVSATHSIYQALRDHTSSATNSPVTEAAAIANPLVADPDPQHWVYVGRTNKWRLVDGRPSQKTANPQSIRAAFRLPSELSSVGILELEDCTSVTVRTIQSGDVAVLKWTSPSNGGKSIQKYQYRKKPSDKATWEAWTDMPAAQAQTTQHELTGLDPDIHYEFQVRAVNADGNASNSNTATLSIETSLSAEAPSAVTSFAVTAGDGQIEVSWDVPEKDGGAEISAYELAVNPASDTETTVTHTLAPYLREQTVGSLVNGSQYRVNIRAKNSSGAGPWQTALTVTPSAALGKPALTVATGSNTSQVVLTWTYTAIANNPATVTGWEYRQKQGTEEWGKWTAISGAGASTRTYTVTGLRAIPYTYQVRAVASSGKGPASDTSSSITPNATAPGAPQTIAANAGIGSIILSWSAPSNDGGATITKWQYRYATTAGGVGSATWADIPGSSVSTKTFAIINLTASTRYYAQIRAVNSVGSGDASLVRNAVVSSTTKAPAAPQSVGAAAASTQITLTWLTGNNNGAAITKYQYQIEPVGSNALFPTMQKFSRGTVANNASYSTLSARCVSTNEDTAYSPPSPITSDYSSPPTSNNYIIRQRFLVSTDKQWNRADVNMPDGCDDAMRIFIFASDPFGTKGALIAEVSRTSYTSSPVKPTTSIADSKWTTVKQADNRYYLYVEAFLIEQYHGGIFDWRLGYRDTSNVISGDKVINATSSGWPDHEPGAWTDVPSSGASTVTHTITGLTDGTGYFVRIRAVNSKGNGDASSPVYATAGASANEGAGLSQPAGLTTTVGNKQVLLGWTQQDNTPDIQYWEVKVGTEEWQRIDGSVEATHSHLVGGLQNGTRYSFAVRPVNVNGPGTASSTVTATPATVPDKPNKANGVAGE